MQKELWVFIRGWVRDSRHWNGFVEHFKDIFPETDIVQIDLPGNGENFRAESPLLISSYVEFVRKQVGQRDRKINLFVVSLAGMVALDWAAKYPNEISKMVVCNSSAGDLSHFYKRLNVKHLPLFLKVIATTDIAKRERLALDLTSNLRDDKDEIAEVWTGYRKEIPISIPNAIRQLVAALIFRANTRSIVCPVLLLASGGDKLVDFQCSVDLYKKTKWPIKTHPSAGHDITLDVPQWVTTQMKEWMNKL